MRSGARCGVLVAAVLAGAATAAGRTGGWVEVSEQTEIRDPFASGITHPSVRYSHTSVVWKDMMVVTHGYQYNRLVKPSAPAWLHDTWAFSFTSKQWTMLNDGKGTAPSPRYGHTAFVHGNTMYFFGGDDGDHVASPTNYRSKHYNDLWKFDLNAKSWSEVPKTDPWPPKRSLHAGAMVGAEYVIYGGLGLDDTWAFDLEKNTWRKFQQPPGSEGPGVRYAVSYAGTATHLYIFGGARSGGSPFDDLWAFELAKGLWSSVSPEPKERAKQVVLKQWPPGRSYGSLLSAQNSDGRSYLGMFGGANCSRGCSCKGDTWLYDPATPEGKPKFELVRVDAEPITRYRQSTVEYQGRFYIFGGESYKPYMYHNSISELTMGEESGAVGGASSMLRGAVSAAKKTLSPESNGLVNLEEP